MACARDQARDLARALPCPAVAGECGRERGLNRAGVLLASAATAAKCGQAVWDEVYRGRVKTAQIGLGTRYPGGVHHD
jgi:hypothetical protein